MKILIATDSFKGSMTSAEAGEAIARGLCESWPAAAGEPPVAFDVVAIADGGEGTVDAFARVAGGERVTVECRGPLSQPVDATFLLLPGGETAVIEMAASSGLTLVGGREDIMRSDTFGLGEQIKAALEGGAKRILTGIGGSATHDCGAGMARALGVRFLDAQERELGTTPSELAALVDIDTSRLDADVDAWRANTRFEVICDVDNPLLGPTGAAAVYSPQKGADPETVERLEEFSRRFAEIMEREIGTPLRDMPGAGAAGGLGFGLAAFLGAELRPGIDVMIEAAGLRERARGADLLVTGEGRMDSQSLRGKAPSGIAAIAKELGVPCVAFCGYVDGKTVPGGNGVRNRLPERPCGCFAQTVPDTVSPPKGASHKRFLAPFSPEPFRAIYEVASLAESVEDAVRRGPELLRELARKQAGELARLVGKQPPMDADARR